MVSYFFPYLAFHCSHWAFNGWAVAASLTLSLYTKYKVVPAKAINNNDKILFILICLILIYKRFGISDLKIIYKENFKSYSFNLFLRRLRSVFYSLVLLNQFSVFFWFRIRLVELMVGILIGNFYFYHLYFLNFDRSYDFIIIIVTLFNCFLTLIGGFAIYGLLGI